MVISLEILSCRSNSNNFIRVLGCSSNKTLLFSAILPKNSTIAFKFSKLSVFTGRCTVHNISKSSFTVVSGTLLIASYMISPNSKIFDLSIPSATKLSEARALVVINILLTLSTNIRFISSGINSFLDRSPAST